MSDYLVFVESNTSGSGEGFIKKAHERGLKTALLTNDIARYPWAASLAQCIACDTNDLNSLKQTIEKFSKSHKIAGILSSSEYYIHACAMVAKTRGLHGPDPQAVETTRHKDRMRTALRQAGLRTPKFLTVKAGDDITKKISELSFPVVVKPAAGSGSEQVLLCRTPEEAQAQIQKILLIKQNMRAQTLPNYVMVEEFISGPEFSVEICCTPKPVAIAVISKHLGPAPFFVETGHDVPAALTDEQRQACIDEAIGAVRALGLNFGCLHIELRLAPQGPTIIEVNPRLAGGMLPTLVEYVYGIDLIEFQIESACGTLRVPAIPEQPLCHASIRFLIPPKDGTLDRVENLETVRAMPGVKEVSVNARLKGFRTLQGDFTDRIGAVIVTHKDRQTCIETAQAALKKLEYIYKKNNEHEK
jgi:biotin carboxylase